mgnify:CR=1 FL=1
MKQRVTIKIMASIVAVVMFALVPGECAGAAQKPTAKKTSFSESELRALAKAVPDVKNAGQLYSVALATSNDADRQQAYLKASAAGLIACGKTDIYKKHIKGKLQNVAEFEAGLKDDCEKCSGAGTKERRCYDCKGEGKCPGCKGSGETVRVGFNVGFNNNNETKPCRKCKGSGRCPKCGGEGSTREKCLSCSGTGRVLSKTVAARVFRDSCNAIADGVDMVASQNKVEDNSEVNVKPEDAVKPDERAETKSDMAKSRTTRRRRRSTEVESLLEQRNVTKESPNSENHDANVKFTGTYTWSYDLNHGDATIKGVSPEIGDIRIPSTVGEGNYPVTGIGHGAFWRCSGLTSVAIPNGVTYIGEGAFRECVNLTSVTIPDSVTDIGVSAFEGCSGLKDLTIGKGVSKIGVSVFSGCSSLTNVTIPESVKYISFRAFQDCESLKNVKTMNPNTIIMNNAFAGCDALANGAGFSVVNGVLTRYSGKGGNVTIPTGVTSIGSYAFASCGKSLASVIIPSSVTSIEKSAFSGCKNLSKVTIEKGVTSIGASAFDGCEGLTSVTIPNSVMSIEEDAFSSCENLTNVTIPDSVTSIGNTAFYHCKSLQSVTIPSSVTSIGERAFYGCKSLNEITIPDSVKRIGNAAFGRCDRITKASIPETLEDFKNEIFDGCKALSFKRGLTVRQLAGSSGYEERVKTYRLEAARGNADAQYELGVCYVKGKGVGKNIAEAAKWWQKAANQGHADAQFQLGCLYYQGEGVKGNLPEAVNLWRKAAAQGQADALCNLGAFYYDGFPAGNVPRDRIEGLRLLRMAVEKGNKNAKEILFRIKWDAGSRDF